MNYRFFFLVFSLVCMCTSLFAIESEQNNRFEFEVNIYYAQTGLRGNGILVVPSLEGRNSIVLNEKDIIAKVKQDFPSSNFGLCIPTLINSSENEPKEDIPYLISIWPIPSLMTEIHLQEILKKYCKKCEIIYFRAAPKDDLLNIFYTIENHLEKEEQNTNRKRNLLKSSLECLSEKGFNTETLKESLDEPNNFRIEWNNFKSNPDLQNIKTAWIEEQKKFIYPLLNKAFIEHDISEPFLSNQLVCFTAKCQSLQDAFSLHQFINQSKLESNSQPVFSKIQINFFWPEMVVLDENCLSFLNSNNSKVYAFISAPISDDNFKNELQSMERIMNSQKTIRLKCTIGNTEEEHDVILIGSPTIQDLDKVFKKRFPGYTNYDLYTDYNESNELELLIS